MCFHVEGLFGNQHMLDNPEQINLIIDTGANVLITPFKEDFISNLKPAQAVCLNGIAGGCDIEGIGNVEYLLPWPNTPPFKLQIDNVLYVPTAPSHLVCPQQLHENSVLQGQHNASFCTFADGATLIHEGEAFHFSLHKPTKLPVLKALRSKNEDSPMKLCADAASLDLSNQEAFMDPNALPMEMHLPPPEDNPYEGAPTQQENTPSEGAPSNDDHTSTL